MCLRNVCRSTTPNTGYILEMDRYYRYRYWYRQYWPFSRVSVSVSARNVSILPIESVSVSLVSAILWSIGIDIAIYLKVGIGICQILGIGPSVVKSNYLPLNTDILKVVQQIYYLYFCVKFQSRRQTSSISSSSSFLQKVELLSRCGPILIPLFYRYRY